MIASAQIEAARQTDLLRLVEPDTTLVRIASTRGGEYAGPCPFCGGTDRFHVQPMQGWWFCRNCAPRGGDAIAYVQRREQVGFPEAIQLLVGHAQRAPRQPQPGCAKPIAAAHWTQPAWQQAAQMLTDEAHQALFQVKGAAARAYLIQRHLQAESWTAWRLGYRWTYHTAQEQGLPAVTMPWITGDGTIQAVQYRFFGAGITKRDRFGQKAGGQRFLFGLHLRQRQPTLVVCEGELNAVSLWQVAHEQADVLSFGSQEGVLHHHTRAMLASLAEEYRQVFIWLDDLVRAAAAVPAIAPANGYALWSEGGLDANDRLRDGSLAAWLAAHGLK
jgi:hypothetical protein